MDQYPTTVMTSRPMGIGPDLSVRPFGDTFEAAIRPQTHVLAIGNKKLPISNRKFDPLSEYSNSKSASSRYNPQSLDETLISKKKEEIENLKREETQKLGKLFASIPLSTRKMLLPRVTAAVFGESSYEIEVIKHVQQYRASNAKQDNKP